MKVLFVISGNGNKIAPFVELQKRNLEELGVEVEYFLINKHGFWGYFSLLARYFKTVRKNKPDIIHAHYGISGLFALTQICKPVIISYIGSDILGTIIKNISYFTMLFSKSSIFVSQSLLDNMPFKLKYFVKIEYGIDLNSFYPIDKTISRIKLGLDVNKQFCLFPSLKTRPEKNFELANKAINKVGGIEIIEIGGTLPLEQLNLIFNACDFMLLTSLHEGGPQVVFEAMATNLPIISTDVGVVRMSLAGLEGCYICTYELADVITKIETVLLFNGRTNGRDRIMDLKLNSKLKANEIKSLYANIIQLNGASNMKMKR
ncbi:MAG: glycosyltransferase [Bacteroidetes bacterium]|nr:glycosyltransferase [Bacteroidota bacterium]